MNAGVVKVISGATLDLNAAAAPKGSPVEEEFFLYHTEPVEASGFCIHFKLPHYVTFGSSLDAMRAVKMMAPARAAKNGYYGDGEELSAATPGVHAEKAVAITKPESGQAGQAEQEGAQAK